MGCITQWSQIISHTIQLKAKKIKNKLHAFAWLSLAGNKNIKFALWFDLISPFLLFSASSIVLGGNSKNVVLTGVLKNCVPLQQIHLTS